MGYQKNPNGFTMLEPMSGEFQTFPNNIRYTEEFKAKKFKKSTVVGLWTVLMHLILPGISCKHGGIDTMRKEWLYVVYIIYYGRSNVVDLTEVLWKDFGKFEVKTMPQEILSLRF